MKHTDYSIKKFELEHSGSLKRMSLGMKRNLAIVTDFMHDPGVLILDEPMSGLDPIMQNVFIEFIKEEKEKEKGKTILLSSHIFSEVDATCDKIPIIKDGRLVSSFIADDLRQSDNKTLKQNLKRMKFSFAIVIKLNRLKNTEIRDRHQEEETTVFFYLPFVSSLHNIYYRNLNKITNFSLISKVYC